MANKKVGYKEPAGYFNAAMKKAARDWEKEQKTKAEKKQTGNEKKK